MKSELSAHVPSFLEMRNEVAAHSSCAGSSDLREAIHGILERGRANGASSEEVAIAIALVRALDSGSSASPRREEP